MDDVALDLAADIADSADDAAKPRRNQAQIALAQFDILTFGQIDQFLDRAVREPSIGRVRDRLLLDRGVHHDPLEIFGLDRLRDSTYRRGESIDNETTGTSSFFTGDCRTFFTNDALPIGKGPHHPYCNKRSAVQ